MARKILTSFIVTYTYICFSGRSKGLVSIKIGTQLGLPAKKILQIFLLKTTKLGNFLTRNILNAEFQK